MVLVQGLPQSIFVFGVTNLFNNTGCKVITFSFRLSRSMSICLTCLMSCFQYATLASTNPKWLYLKNKMQIFLIPITFFLILNVGYCLVIFPNKMSFQANGFTIFARDLVFVIIMVLASANILLLLYFHGKQATQIRSSKQDPENTMERKASETVVTLVSLYALFFGIDTTIWLYQAAVSSEVQIVISDIRNFFSTCYASVFPIVTIIFNKNINTKVKYSIGRQQNELQDKSFMHNI
ncbi:olfactory receptor class A-like protein 1 [Protopterus annectens]|uniref:olfactory receptor class A-like protein 1 n=1 Tax=Protopterus annectens TaxID=7888 RepID=UPI001CFA0C02|nr:olfactory receptor class A-like protein 1 [Protopterus annectens]